MKIHDVMINKDKQYILKKHIVLKHLEYGGRLKDLNEEMQNDYDIVLAAVKFNPLNLKYAKDKFKNNREIVETALKKQGRVLKYASLELQNNKEIVLLAINNCGFSYFSEMEEYLDHPLSYISSELRNDKEIVLTSVKRDGMLLEYASEELKKDKEIVLTAVQNDSLSLKFACEELKQDKEIISVIENKKHKEILNLNKYNNDTISEFTSNELITDEKTALIAIKKECKNFKSISEDLQTNFHFVIKALNSNIDVFKYLNDDMQFIVLDELGLLNEIMYGKIIDKLYAKRVQTMNDIIFEDPFFTSTAPFVDDNYNVSPLQEIKLYDIFEDLCKNNYSFLFDKLWKIMEELEKLEKEKNVLTRVK